MSLLSERLSRSMIEKVANSLTVEKKMRSPITCTIQTLVILEWKKFIPVSKS